jgi:hypothetical protein
VSAFGIWKTQNALLLPSASRVSAPDPAVNRTVAGRIASK